MQFLHSQKACNQKEVTGMKLTDFYNNVARSADTDKTAISVADTKRVLSEAFLHLAKLDAADCADTLAKGLVAAQKKIAKGA